MYKINGHEYYFPTDELLFQCRFGAIGEKRYLGVTDINRYVTWNWPRYQFEYFEKKTGSQKSKKWNIQQLESPVTICKGQSDWGGKLLIAKAYNYTQCPEIILNKIEKISTRSIKE